MSRTVGSVAPLQRTIDTLVEKICHASAAGATSAELVEEAAKLLKRFSATLTTEDTEGVPSTAEEKIAAFALVVEEAIGFLCKKVDLLAEHRHTINQVLLDTEMRLRQANGYLALYKEICPSVIDEQHDVASIADQTAELHQLTMAEKTKQIETLGGKLKTANLQIEHYQKRLLAVETIKRRVTRQEHATDGIGTRDERIRILELELEAANKEKAALQDTVAAKDERSSLLEALSIVKDNDLEAASNEKATLLDTVAAKDERIRTLDALLTIKEDALEAASDEKATLLVTMAAKDERICTLESKLEHEKTKAIEWKAEAERLESLWGKEKKEDESLEWQSTKDEQLVAGLLVQLVRVPCPKAFLALQFLVRNAHTMFFAFTVSSGRQRRRHDEWRAEALCCQDENRRQHGRWYRR